MKRRPLMFTWIPVILGIATGLLVVAVVVGTAVLKRREDRGDTDDDDVYE